MNKGTKKHLERDTVRQIERRTERGRDVRRPRDESSKGGSDD